MKKPKYKVFDYEPRFYNPEEDPEEQRKKKLGFQSARKMKGKKHKSAIVWLVVFFIVLYMFFKLQGVM